MKLTRFRHPETPPTTPSGAEPSQLDWIHNQIDRLLRNPFSLASSVASTFFEGWTPTVDIYEDKDKITVQAQLPGMKKEDIEVSLHGDTLAISGERKHEEQEKKGETFRSERYFGRFQRSVTLPNSVDPGKVEAKYKDGILTVACQKTEEAKRRQIEVKTA